MSPAPWSNRIAAHLGDAEPISFLNFRPDHYRPQANSKEPEREERRLNGEAPNTGPALVAPARPSDGIILFGPFAGICAAILLLIIGLVAMVYGIAIAATWVDSTTPAWAWIGGSALAICYSLLTGFSHFVALRRIVFEIDSGLARAAAPRR
ncbi:MAG: hypothetical protein AAGF31_06625 [Planctomycetota bacterium]